MGGAIQEGLQRIAHARSWTRLLRRIGITFVVIMVGVLLLWVFVRAESAWTNKSKPGGTRLPSLRFRGLELLPARSTSTPD